MFWSQPAISFEYKFRTEDREHNTSQIYLDYSPCSANNDVLALLWPMRQWKQNLGEVLPDLDLKSVKVNDHTCSVEISNHLPLKVQEIHGKTTMRSGPNCWNTTLTIGQILPALRYSTETEFTAVMNSPLCRKISKKEKARPGDFVAIRERKEDKIDEYHAYTDLGNGLVFSKNGPGKTVPFLLQKEKDMLAIYKMDKEPPSCHLTDESNPKQCHYFSQRYRCETWLQYLNKQEKKIDKQIADIHQSLSQIECLTSQHIFQHSSGLPTIVLDNFVAILNVLEKQAKDQLEHLGPATNNDKVEKSINIQLWNIILARIHAINQQLDWIAT